MTTNSDTVQSCGSGDSNKIPSRTIDEHIIDNIIDNITDNITDNVSDRTIIIFDWDDTLLPSSHVSGMDPSQIDAETKQNLLDCEKIVINILTRVSETYKYLYIVTNAEDLWVQMSMEKYYKTLLTHDVMKKIKIVSARSTYQDKFPQAPQKWKYLAMHDILTSVFVDLITDTTQNNQSGSTIQNLKKQIISFGDDNCEREAVISLSKTFPQIYAKSVKFVIAPKCIQIGKQLEFLQNHINYISSCQTNLDLQLAVTESSPICTDTHTDDLITPPLDDLTQKNESSDNQKYIDIHDPESEHQNNINITRSKPIPIPGTDVGFEQGSDDRMDCSDPENEMIIDQNRDSMDNPMDNPMDNLMDDDSDTSEDEEIVDICNRIRNITLR